MATASPGNHALLRGLARRGRSIAAVPRRSATSCGRLEGRIVAGAMAIGAGSAGARVDVVGACAGSKVVCMAGAPVSFEDAPAGRGRRLWPAGKLCRLAAGSLDLTLRSGRPGIRCRFISGSSLLRDDLGRTIVDDVLPRVLASGSSQAVPASPAAGAGLSAVPDAPERRKRGVAARKTVLTL